MKLYVWRSEALKNYARGHVVAVGEDVEDARNNARKHFDTYLKERYYYYDDANPEDTEELNFKRWELEADISQEPAVLEAVFIEGSE